MNPSSIVKVSTLYVYHYILVLKHFVNTSVINSINEKLRCCDVVTEVKYDQQGLTDVQNL